MEDNSLEDRLLPSERILWSGAPAQGILFTGRDAFLVPFSLVWCGFAVFWTFEAMKSGAPFMFYMVGALFVCIGLFFVFGRFAIDAWLRQQTSYAVTDRRILIARAGPFSSFTSIDLDRLPEVQITGAGKARGNLRFGVPSSMYWNRGFSSWTPALDPTPQFLGIEDPVKVYDLVMNASETRRSGTAAR